MHEIVIFQIVALFFARDVVFSPRCISTAIDTSPASKATSHKNGASCCHPDELRMTLSPHLSSPSDYMVGVTIGEGAFGHVLYGRHKQTQLDVAIKIILKLAVEKNPSILTSILQERNILTRCNDNPHIVSLYASFHDEQCLYLVMECATRGTLQSVIKECSRDTTTTWVVPYYTHQLLQALEYLHYEQDIIHADLKPDNILVSERGILQLCDFGSAIIVLQSDEHSQQSILFQPRGTADYAAPELIRNHSDMTRAVDLWSLGCIVYAMLHSTSESPFHAPSDALCIDKIRNYVENYNRETTFHEIPTEWKDLVHQLLNPHPAQRGDAGSIHSHLKHLFGMEMLKDPFLPAHASWWNEAHETPMRDGSQGWSVYLTE